jgi:hypothetical protein
LSEVGIGSSKPSALAPMLVLPADSQARFMPLDITARALDEEKGR